MSTENPFQLPVMKLMGIVSDQMAVESMLNRLYRHQIKAAMAVVAMAVGSSGQADEDAVDADVVGEEVAHSLRKWLTPPE